MRKHSTFAWIAAPVCAVCMYGSPLRSEPPDGLDLDSITTARQSETFIIGEYESIILDQWNQGSAAMAKGDYSNAIVYLRVAWNTRRG